MAALPLTSCATSLGLHFLFSKAGTIMAPTSTTPIKMIIHIKHYAFYTVSAQQMLNVTIANGPKTIIMGKEGMNAFSQEIRVFSCLEGSERFRGWETESASAKSWPERSGGWAGTTLQGPCMRTPVKGDPLACCSRARPWSDCSSEQGPWLQCGKWFRGMQKEA